MKRECVTSPAHSIILIMDPSHGEIPENLGQQVAAFSNSCIAVGTRMELDGPTRIVLERGPTTAPASNMKLAYRGTIECPNRSVSVLNVEGDALLSLETAGDQCDAEIWVNDEFEPDEILVSIS